MDFLAPTAERTTWGDVFDAFAHPGPYLGTRDHPGWSPGRFAPAMRARPNLRAISGLVLDYQDRGEQAFVSLCGAWEGTSAFVHTLRRGGLRIVLPLRRAITVAEHGRLVAWASKHASQHGLTLAPRTGNAARFLSTPGVPPGARYDARELAGTVLDPDDILRRASAR